MEWVCLRFSALESRLEALASWSRPLVEDVEGPEHKMKSDHNTNPVRRMTGKFFSVRSLAYPIGIYSVESVRNVSVQGSTCTSSLAVENDVTQQVGVQGIVRT